MENLGKRKEVISSRDNIVAKFFNYHEAWENDTIKTKNHAHASRLNDKSEHIFLLDH